MIKYYQSFGFKTVDYYLIPDRENIPIQSRGNQVILLEYNCNPLKPHLKFLSAKDYKKLYQLVHTNQKRLKRFFPITLTNNQTIEDTQQYLLELEKKKENKEVFVLVFI